MIFKQYCVIYCVKGLWKVNKNTQCIQDTIKSFKYLMISWIIVWPVEWSAWITRQLAWKTLLTRRYLGKWLNVIRSSILEKHGNNTDIGVKYPYSERSPSLKAGVTLTIFKSSGNISFSGDKSDINVKETYSSPNRFLTTLKLILLQPQHLGRCSLSVSLFLRNSSALSKLALLNSCVVCNGNNDT